VVGVYEPIGIRAVFVAIAVIPRRGSLNCQQHPSTARRLVPRRVLRCSTWSDLLSERFALLVNAEPVNRWLCS
jgi:hypothetical protein